MTFPSATPCEDGARLMARERRETMVAFFRARLAQSFSGTSPSAGLSRTRSRPDRGELLRRPAGAPRALRPASLVARREVADDLRAKPHEERDRERDDG